jgi:hypothetical protein
MKGTSKRSREQLRVPNEGTQKNRSKKRKAYRIAAVEKGTTAILLFL